MTTLGLGRQNVVSGNCSVIVGGTNNLVASNDSSILGCNGNVIPAGVAFNNVHIVGSGINAAIGAPNALHVNSIWANAIPGPFAVVPVALTVGTVYYGPAGVPGANVLYIR